MNAVIALVAALFAVVGAGCANPRAEGSGARAEAAPAAPAEPVRRLPIVAVDDDAPPPAVELSPQLLFQLLAADIAAQRGELGSAWSTYMSLARQTRDPRIARRAAETAISGRALEQAVQATQLWRELAPDSRAAQQTLETLWLGSGRLEQMEPVLAERLARARREGSLPAAYTDLQRGLARVQDRAGAWRLVQRLSEPDLNVAAARLARASAAAAADEPAAAAAEASEALRLAPDDEAAAVAAARALHALPERRQEALALLERFLQRAPMSLEARYAYARLLIAEGRRDDARAQLDRANAQAPDNPAVLFSLAQVAYQGKQYDDARRHLERLIELPRSVPRDNASAFLFLAQIAEDQGRVPEAIAWLERVPRGDDWVPALIRRAQLVGKTGQVEAARAMLRDASVTQTRERVQLLSAEAQVLRDARRYQEAFDVLAGGLERMPDNPDLLYDHAMAAEKIDRLPVMETSLRRLIELRPDHAHAHNALGYTFADRNMRLDEARTLIERALQLAPDDAHILDSMGWVLFRQQDLPRALEYLRRAYALRQDAEIAAHLGEVLWALGRADEARALWREARGREPDNTTLRETLARLNVSL
jgi:tetratricopeptide (TPR) repeat protein